MTVVGIAEFKAHLSHYLRQAQAGEPVTITDRGVPVAELSQPGAKIKRREFRSPTLKLSEIRIPPPLDLGDLDPVALLLEMRQNHR